MEMEPSYWSHPVEEMEPILNDNEMGAVAERFGRVLEWASRGSSLVAMGQRMYVMLYILRPALINGMTLEQIGNQNAVTRQMVDKLICDFRDTFGGIQTRNERSERTRARCRKTDSERTFYKKPIEQNLCKH